VIDAVRSEVLIERVRERGAALRQELADALADVPMVREVRGHGYLLGVSFVDPRDGASFLPPTLRVGGRIDATAFDQGLIVLSTQPTRDGFAGDQTLFAPAFTATDEELGEMVSRFADVVHEVAKDVEPELEAVPVWSGGGG
jgi:adenosylmethionine-8-amino-7-oxononanoate aminotransferase